jgi:hypothetical protein
VDAPGFGGRDEDLQPLVVVFEPDLLDNAGLADRRTAMLALRLIAAASAKTSERGVTFDLTLAGVGAAQSADAGVRAAVSGRDRGAGVGLAGGGLARVVPVRAGCGRRTWRARWQGAGRWWPTAPG